MSHKDKLHVGDTELHQFSHNRLHTADLEIQQRTLTRYTQKHNKRVQKDFQKAKPELCNVSGPVWSQILLDRINPIQAGGSTLCPPLQVFSLLCQNGL